MNPNHMRMGKLALAGIFAIGSTTAYASSFSIIEQSITGLGNAFAGGSAGAEDASTIYFNPAGLRHLKGTRYEFGVNLIRPSAEFDDNGSTHVTTAPLDVNNEDGGDAGTLGVVPNFYYSRELDTKWTVGLGVNAPFGLVSDYNDGWVGRYHATRSELTTININPSVAYQATPSLSLGFGVSAQYIEASLGNAVDFGTIFAATMAVAPQAADGEATVEGDDWSFGYNFGLMWQATEDTRIGAAYRSRIKHKLEGDVDFESSALVSTLIAGFGGGRFVDTDVEASVTLPDTLSVGFYHQANDRLSIVGDVTWTNWSLLDELRIEFDNPAESDNVTTLDWDDSYRYSLGFNYKYSDKWVFRAGVAYDEAAAQKAESLTARVPDEDRTWIAFGATYSNAKNNMKIDFGYAHLFVDDADVRRVITGGPTTDENFFRGNLIGEYELDANILSAQARWLF